MKRYLVYVNEQLVLDNVHANSYEEAYEIAENTTTFNDFVNSEIDNGKDIEYKFVATALDVENIHTIRKERECTPDNLYIDRLEKYCERLYKLTEILVGEETLWQEGQYETEMTKLLKEVKRYKKDSKMYGDWVNKLQGEKSELEHRIGLLNLELEHFRKCKG